MDWVQIMMAVGATAPTVLAIDRVIRTVLKKPGDKPVRNGERQNILTELKDLKDIVLEQNATIGSLQRDVRGHGGRLLRIERAVAGSEGPHRSTPGSTD